MKKERIQPIFGMNCLVSNKKELQRQHEEDRKATVERFPEKKWMLDPFVGFIEKR